MKAHNLIAVLLFLAATVWVLTRSPQTVRSIQVSYYKLITPFLGNGTPLKQKAQSFLSEVEHSDIWKTRYSLAEKELAIKRMEVAHLRKLEGENAQMKEALGFAQESPFKVLAARVISRNPSTWWKTFVIDRGTGQKLKSQYAVLSPMGLVGKTDIISQDISTVILLTDEKCKVSAKIDGTQEFGILSGRRGISEANPLLVLHFLSKNAHLTPGMRVFTTGRGGLFPADILLGSIVSFKSGPLYGEALVKPAVDFSKIDLVFVKMPTE